MPKGEASIRIAAPPATVFGYVSDLRRHGEWSANPLTITPADGTVGVGSVFESSSRIAGTTQRDRIVITRLDPPHVFAFETTGTAGATTHVIELTSDGDGTVVRKSFHVTKPSALIRLVGWLTGPIAGKALRADLEKIKRRMEGGTR